jgi:hypothetical protein
VATPGRVAVEDVNPSIRRRQINKFVTAVVVDDPLARADGERMDVADGEVPHDDRTDLDRVALDRARRAVEPDDPGARVEGRRLDPTRVGQEAMVGRRLDRLAVDPEMLDLLVGVDVDVGDGVLGDLARAGVAGDDGLADVNRRDCGGLHGLSGERRPFYAPREERVGCLTKPNGYSGAGVTYLSSPGPTPMKPERI